MTAIVGIDPSLTAAGVAIIRRDLTIAVNTHGKPGHDTDTYPETSIRIGQQAYRIWNVIPTDTILVVIETPGAPMIKAPGRYQERCALFFRLVEALTHEQHCPVAVVQPSVVKHFATGNGRAKKPVVVAAMRELWPGVRIEDDNQADALTLATIGAQHLGWCEPAATHHFAPKAHWPKEITHA